MTCSGADDPTRSSEDRATAQAAADDTGADVNIGLVKVRARFGAGHSTAVTTLADQLQASIVSLPAALKAAAAGSTDLKDMNATHFNAAINGTNSTALKGAAARLQSARDAPPLSALRALGLEDAVVDGLTAARRLYLAASATLAVALVKSESKQRIDSHDKLAHCAGHF